MALTCPVCRADHIGSLLRPDSLRAAYRRFNNGELPLEQFNSALDDAIRNSIAEQESIGLGAVTDGEFRRRSWFAGFVDATTGLTHKDTYFDFTSDANDRLSVPVPYAEGPIRRETGITTGEFLFANSVATKPVKISMPSPAVIHFFRGAAGIDPTVYPDIEEFWADLLRVYQQELSALGELGCQYVQLDEVPMALLCDPSIQARIAEWGWNWQQLLAQYIDVTNRALTDRPTGMVVGMHLCRGNFRGHWIGSGSYEPVAERLFNEVDVDTFLLEYDSERAGDFSPLRFLPESKSVVLGLISSKTSELESPAELRKRLDEASHYVPMERLAISPQCGFGTTVGGAPMSEAEQRRKLELVVATADAAWG